MFIRIMQLGIALYYGEIGNFKDGESEDLVRHSKDMLGNITGKCHFYFLKRNVKNISFFAFSKYQWPRLVIAKRLCSLLEAIHCAW